MDLRRLQSKAFKKAVRDDDGPGKCSVVKGLTCEVTKAEGEDAGDRRLQFSITTGDVDRDNDTVNPKGATNLDRFPQTGVVLWAHDARLPPIAKPVKVWTEDNAIKSIAEFTPADMGHPLGMGFGDTVRRQFAEGYMKSVSIGFIPEEWAWSEERASDDGFATGIDFKAWELLEFSAVPVPANREALVELAAKGMDLSGVYEWTTRCLDGDAGELVVPRHLVEDARAGLAELYGRGQKVLDFGAKAPADEDEEDGDEDEPADEPAPDAPADEPEPDDEPMDDDDEEDEEAEGGDGAQTKPDDDKGDDEEDEDKAAQAKRGRVLSSKNEGDLKAARDLIDGVIAQVQAQDEGDDEPKAIEVVLEELAAGDALPLEQVDRIVRAAAEIAHKAQPVDPAQSEEEEIVDFVREVAIAAAEEAIRKHSGRLP